MKPFRRAAAPKRGPKSEIKSLLRLPGFWSLYSRENCESAKTESVSLVARGGDPLPSGRFIAWSIDAVRRMMHGEGGIAEAFGIEPKCAQSASWLSGIEEIASARGRVSAAYACWL